MTATAPTVAVLGTGIMGAAMARSLLRDGLTVQVWNRTSRTSQPLTQDGALVAPSAADAARGADVVITSLHDESAVAEVMDAAAPGLRAGAVWLQTTTVGADAAPRLIELADSLGIILVDAPVLGTRGPAEKGALTVLAAGERAVRERIGPVLGAISTRVVWAGEQTGAATRLKLVANSWVIAVTAAAGEAVALAEALGVDPHLFLDVVGGGPLDMPYLQTKADLIIEGSLTPPSFATATAAKDAGLITRAAEDAGIRLDVAAASRERLQRAIDAGHGGDDMAAAYFAS